MADADLRRELLDRWEDSIHEIGELMANDPSGVVCQTVCSAFPESDVEFDLDVWKRLTERQRRIVAEGWKDSSVEGGDDSGLAVGIVPVELVAADYERLEKKATKRQWFEYVGTEYVGPAGMGPEGPEASDG